MGSNRSKQLIRTNRIASKTKNFSITIDKKLNASIKATSLINPRAILGLIYDRNYKDILMTSAMRLIIYLMTTFRYGYRVI